MALGSLIGWRISDRKQAEAELVKGSGSKGDKKAPAVETALAGPAVFKEEAVLPATLATPTRQLVSPISTGRISKIAVQEGDRVTAGQALVWLDSSDALAQIASAEAAVAEAKARYAQAQLVAEATTVGVSARVDEQRAAANSAGASLDQVSRNRESLLASAKAQVDDAQAQLSASESQVRNAEAVVDREKANLRNAETRLARTRKLYQDGFIAAQDLDDAQTAREVQANTVRVADAALQQVRESVKSASARVSVAQQGLQIAERRAATDLAVAKAAQAQSQSQLRTAKANRAQSPAYRANLEALDQAVKAAEAGLTQAKTSLENTILRASMDGVVAVRSADPGSLASPGQPILTLEATETLDVVASVPVETAARLKEGQAGVLRVEGLDNREFSASIRQLSPGADGQSRQVTLRASLVNDKKLLRPGMFGSFSIGFGKTRASVAVPRTAVRDAEGIQQVRVVQPDGSVKVIPVVLGAQNEWKVEIKSGLNAGDQVVVMSYQTLREGQKIASPPAGAGAGSGSGSAQEKGPR